MSRAEHHRLGIGERFGVVLARAVSVLALALAASNCTRRSSPAPADAPDASAASVATPASVAPSNSASAAGTQGARVGAGAASAAADAGPADARKDSWAIWAAAISAGRAASNRRDYPAAIAAFDRAVAAQPTDARARAERGFVKLLAGDTSGAWDDLETASGLSVQEELDAQIWFNLGLLDEKAGRTEDARIDFAISNLVRPSKAAAEKLRGHSACPVRRTTRDPHDLPIAANFREVYAIIKPSEKPPATEAEAKAEVCRTEYASAGNLRDSPAPCTGPPPWATCRDYFSYRCFETILVPTGKRFLVVQGAHGGWPAQCMATSMNRAEVRGSIVRVSRWRVGDQSVFVPENLDIDGVAHPNDQATCLDGVGSETDELYDAKTGKALLRLERVVPKRADKSPVELEVEGRAVVLRGRGCAERIALDAPEQR